MRSMTPQWSETFEARALTRLFAVNCATVMNSLTGQELICLELDWNISDYAARSQQTAFNDAFSKILAIRKRVDTIIANVPKDYAAQFRKSTALLKKYRKQNAMAEMGIARKIIEHALVPTWNSAQQAEFTKIAEFFERYIDYFLSYTNKRAHQINFDFSKALYSETKSLLKAHGTTANLLARQIVEHLSGLRGFYDKDRVLLGDKIRAEILSGASSALVFLQVLVRAMLDEPNEADNWCFKEYIAYCDEGTDVPAFGSRERRFVFPVAEKPDRSMRRPAEAVAPFAEIRDPYTPWYEKMLELATLVLERRPPEKLTEQIEVVARQIATFRNSIIDSVVDEEFAAGLVY